MKSLTGKFASTRGWALLLILLLGGGFLVAACGDEDTPTPTTPPPALPPTPPPAPEPEPEPPNTPAGLRIATSGPDFIEWTWTMAEGVSGYDVQYSTNEAFTAEDEIIARTAEEISYRRSGLSAGTSAYLRVRSAQGTGEERITSEWSSHVGGMTEAPPVAPATPSGFGVAAQTESSITWSWTAVEGAHGYLVQISTDATFDESDRHAVTTETSYTLTSLEPGATVYARVAAGVLTAAAPSQNPGDYLLSPWTSPSMGTTSLTAPAIPTGVRVSAFGENFIEWSWSEVAGAHGYQVEHSRNEQFANSTTDDVDADTRSYRLEDLPSETTVYLRVRAFVGTGDARLESDWSIHRAGRTEPPPVMAPDTPTINRTVERGEDFIEWTWNAVTGADGYEVQFSLDGQFSGARIEDRAADERSYRKEGLDPETFGHLRVRAYAMDGGERKRSMWSESATAITLSPSVVAPSAPQGLRVSAKGDNFIEWTWNPVPDVDGYQVLYSDNASLTKEDTIVDRTAEETSYRKTGLTPGTEHYLQVRAFREDGDRKLPSAWTPPSGVPGRTDLAPVPVPTGLEVDDDETNHNSIRWTWDAVEGAGSIQYQFSLERPIPDNLLANTTDGLTYHVVHGLEPRTRGYFRVRTVMGARKSKWSDTNEGTTTGPPAPASLDAPTGVEGGQRQRNSITVTWNRVVGAETYNVEQSASGGTYTRASCGGGDDDDNEVNDTRCVATDLTPDTPYRFRVSASASDRTTSDWSRPSNPVSTIGQASGGMGDLNIKWESDQDSIEFAWERVSGATYQYSVLADDKMSSANPCRDVQWLDVLFASRSEPVEGPGEVKGLCVRTSDGGRVSYAWGISAPEEPGPTDKAGSPDPGGTETQTDNKTTAIEWDDVSLKKGFDYEIYVAADLERSSQIRATAKPIHRAVQDACAAGTEVESGTADITYTQTTSVSRNLKEHTGYLLCVRYRNDTGASTWSVPVTTDDATDAYADTAYDPDDTSNFVVETFTRPAKPPQPKIVDALTSKTRATEGSNGSIQPVWSSPVRDVMNVPRQSTGFAASAWVSERAAAKGLTSANCVAADGTAPQDYAVLTLATPPIKDTGMGIQIETDAAQSRSGFDQKVYLCLRAVSSSDVDEGGEGPWEISPLYTINKPVGLSASVKFARTVTAGDPNPKTYDVDVTIAIQKWNTAWSYSTENPSDNAGASCASDLDAGTAETTVDWNDLALREKRIVKVFAAAACAKNALIKTSTYTNPSR